MDTFQFRIAESPHDTEPFVERKRGASWAVVLAGGDGTRLRPLTRRITGDERPKQFCPILGRETLLEMTLRRISLAVPADRTVVVLTEIHESFYNSILKDAPPCRPLIQPNNRGTAPAILYNLLRVASLDPKSSVAIFPSDHYISDDEAFMYCVEAAFEAIRVMPASVILLGINPDGPEIEYGWIEPAESVFVPASGTLFRVRRFWEKPLPGLAERLFSKGCFWNSFVMVGRVQTLLSLIDKNIPHLYHPFRRLIPAFNTPRETQFIRELYNQLLPSNFSQEVLARCPSNLLVYPLTGIDWCDWGEPSRVLSSLARIGIQPKWATAPRAAAAQPSA
jgi:mannose-1-phosphate guanylyltransferase